MHQTLKLQKTNFINLEQQIIKNEMKSKIYYLFIAHT